MKALLMIYEEGYKLSQDPSFIRKMVELMENPQIQDENKSIAARMRAHNRMRLYTLSKDPPERQKLLHETVGDYTQAISHIERNKDDIEGSPDTMRASCHLRKGLTQMLLDPSKTQPSFEEAAKILWYSKKNSLEEIMHDLQRRRKAYPKIRDDKKQMQEMISKRFPKTRKPPAYSKEHYSRLRNDGGVRKVKSRP